MTTALISLKSKRFVEIDDLQSINKLSPFDSSVTKITDFDNYHLTSGQNLTFVGQSKTVTLNSIVI
ncbi:hypothetical protein [Vallitalea guaymasensis]|uniref:hypothetical protein n=1 Tax=Vallitalea guaymasensis TaxID=1185412 RepID=UPI000DE2D08B|nr:hypothetical protein [Vallitalea guaymasensis]